MKSEEIWLLSPGDMVRERDGTLWRVVDAPRESKRWGVRVPIRCVSWTHHGMRSSILGGHNGNADAFDREAG